MLIQCRYKYAVDCFHRQLILAQCASHTLKLYFKIHKPCSSNVLYAHGLYNTDKSTEVQILYKYKYKYKCNANMNKQLIVFSRKP